MGGVGLSARVTSEQRSQAQRLASHGNPEQCWQPEQPGRKSSAFEELKMAEWPSGQRGIRDREESGVGESSRQDPVRVGVKLSVLV